MVKDGVAEAVVVVGTGTMGRGIALLAAQAGFAVRLADSQKKQVEAAGTWVVERLHRDDPERAAELEGNLALMVDATAACEGADYVIEAVVEDARVKADVLGRAGAVAASDAVLATNTSAISITQIASMTHRSDQVVGMHFFNPAHRMRLCEVIEGVATSARTKERAIELAGALGRTPVVCTDSPGFVASRLNVALGNEALRMLQEGVATADAIDEAARLGLNHPMGPLQLLDMVGLDVRLAVLETMQAAYGEVFRPVPLHRRLVAAGRLGMKAGAGIYEYDAKGDRVR